MYEFGTIPPVIDAGEVVQFHPVPDSDPTTWTQGNPPRWRGSSVAAGHDDWPGHGVVMRYMDQHRSDLVAFAGAPGRSDGLDGGGRIQAWRGEHIFYDGFEPTLVRAAHADP